MRIAYVSLHWPRTRDSGVGKKVQSQLFAWAKQGHEARLFMHTTPHQSQTDLIDAAYFFYNPVGGFGTEINRIQAASSLVAAVREYHPELIYLRYGVYVYPIHSLAGVAPVIEEINTDDLVQHESLGGVYSFYNRCTRGLLLRRVSGLVTVSHELSKSPSFAPYRKPTKVISNGIDLSLVQPVPAPRNETPHLLFIGTPGYAWHGVDKLGGFADRHPDIELDIVGNSGADGGLPGNMHFHGYMSTSKYMDILRRADAAVSTLALHRVKMEEASPLKTREYLAFGLPVVLPYMDTDLMDLDCSFLLKIPNREDNLETHSEVIHDFVFRMRGQRADRGLIADRIDSSSKEMARLDFFQEIIHGSNAQ